MNILHLGAISSLDIQPARPSNLNERLLKGRNGFPDNCQVS
jgi:hypothetical protein